MARKSKADKSKEITFRVPANIPDELSIPTLKDYSATFALNLDFFLHSVHELHQQWRKFISESAASRQDQEDFETLLPEVGIFSTCTDFVNDAALFSKTLQEKIKEMYPELVGNEKDARDTGI